MAKRRTPIGRGLSGRATSRHLDRRDVLRLFGATAAALQVRVLTGCKDSSDEYDYIIVGAGSSGCALAARLLADTSARILLVEAGGANDEKPILDFTQSFLLTQPDSPFDWGFKSEPQQALLNKEQSFSCGKVLGGSSSINGMVWVRGNPADYDGWAALGCEGWDAESVRPSFDAIAARVRVSSEMSAENALSQGIVDAAVALGYPFNPDYNGADQLGVGFTQLNVVDQVRQDAYHTMVQPYADDRHLDLLLDTMVTRIVFDSSRTVDRVLLRDESGESSVSAREVIVCSGTVNTPRLLQLSGLGAAADLEPLGIRVVADLPGVGQNLHDHLISVVAKRLRKPESAAHVTAMDVDLFTGSGPNGTPRFQVQSYYMRFGWNSYPSEAVAFGLINLHPTSRGFVKIRSTDPDQHPIVQPNFLSTSDDLASHIEGYELIRELLNAPGLASWLVDDEAVPGRSVATAEQLIAAIRQYSESDFHAVGTCRMGTDEMAVVDPQLRVRGVKGLRLASAAIMPNVTSGNTNAPSMMIGDRCGRWIVEGR